MRPTEQIFNFLSDNRAREVRLPGPSIEVLPGIPWGAFDEIATPAYWFVQAWMHSRLGTYEDLRLGRTIAEELAACLLGGYGMPADLGLAAYKRLRDRKLIFAGVTPDALELALSEPFFLGGRLRNYRFSRQKSGYLSRCLLMLSHLNDSEFETDVDLRDALVALPGVGPKTASWIVRNFRNSDQVAIIDVHILNAGRLMGLFSEDENPQQDYFALERRFIDLATAMTIRASMLDALIWDQMRRLSPTLRASSRPARSHKRPANRREPARGQLAFGT